MDSPRLVRRSVKPPGFVGVHPRFHDVPAGGAGGIGCPSFPWLASDGRGHREVFETFSDAVAWLAERCAAPGFEEPGCEDVEVGRDNEPPPEQIIDLEERILRIRNAHPEWAASRVVAQALEEPPSSAGD